MFGQFAAEWFPALMGAVLGVAEAAAEAGIHSLLLDVSLMCLTWQDLFPALHTAAATTLHPQVKLAADALMDYLVKPCPQPATPGVSYPLQASCQYVTTTATQLQTL